MDLFQWTSHQWAWLLRPNATLKKHLEDLKVRLNWETKRPILGLHVRHGDVCTHPAYNIRECDGLDKYMEHVVQLAEVYGYKSIFLSTDSADVVSNSSKYMDFAWIHSPSQQAQKRDPRIYFDFLWGSATPKKADFNTVWKELFDDLSDQQPSLPVKPLHLPAKPIRSLVPTLQPTKLSDLDGIIVDDIYARESRDLIKHSLSEFDFDAEFRDFIVDIMLLADTDGFVGKFTSNVDRIAYSLGVGQRGCAVPFISLDSYWCNNFGKQTGKIMISDAPFWC